MSISFKIPVGEARELDTDERAVALAVYFSEVSPDVEVIELGEDFAATIADQLVD